MTKRLLFILIALLTLPLGVRAQAWETDENGEPYVSENLLYYIDREAGIARCSGIHDKSLTTVTIPTTARIDGRSYRVTTVGMMAFYESQVADLTILSTDENFSIEGLLFDHAATVHMKATIPPSLLFNLAINIETFQAYPVTVYVPQGCAEAYLNDEMWSQHTILEEGGGTTEALSLSVKTQAGRLLDNLRQLSSSYRMVSKLTISGTLNEEDIHDITNVLTNLKELDLTNVTNTTLPDGAFQESRLTSITLPKTLRSISQNMFYFCSKLKEVHIYEGLQEIGSCAFSYCQELHYLELPSSLVRVGMQAFAFNSTLMGSSAAYTIRFNGFFPPSFSYSFNCYGASVEIQVPQISVESYKETDELSEFTITTHNTIPENLSIGSPRELSTDQLGKLQFNTVSLLPADEYSYEPGGSLITTGSQVLSTDRLEMYRSLYYDHPENPSPATALVANSPMKVGECDVHLEVREHQWLFLSFPFDIRLSDVTLDSRIRNWVVRSYSSTRRAQGMSDQWVDVNYNTVLKANHAYIWYFSASSDLEEENEYDLEVHIRGTLPKDVQDLSQEVSLSLSPYAATYIHNQGWNHVGNPYPCFYDISYLNLTAPITVWDSYENEYLTFSPLDDELVLSPFQAFFIQKPNDASKLIFNKEGRNVTSDLEAGRDEDSDESTGDVTIEAPMHRARRLAPQRQLINLTLTDGIRTDRTRIVLNEEASSGYEQSCDASKFFSPDNQMSQLYSLIGNVPCAINERPLGEGQFPLGVRFGNQSEYTLSLASADTISPIMLEDKFTGELTDLSAGHIYTFTGVSGTTQDARFVLHVGSAATGIQQVATQQSATVYDLQGRPIGAGAKPAGIYIQNHHKIMSK